MTLEYGSKRIGVLGMAIGGVDGEIRSSFLEARASNDPWIMSDGGHEWSGVRRMKPSGTEFDAYIGRFSTTEQVDAVFQPSIPVIDFDDRLDDPRLYRVCPDERLVGQMAADFLIGRGFKCFQVYPFFEGDTLTERCEAFRNRVIERGFPCDLPPDPQELERHYERLLDAGKPVATFAKFDRFAAFLSDWMRNAEIEVPDQVAILGVDNTRLFCESTLPTISSVALPTKQIGRLAYQLLKSLFAGEPIRQRVHTIPPLGVVERASTEFSSSRDPLVQKAVRIIREEACTGVRVVDIAARLRVKRTTLDSRFRAVTGKNMGEELRRTKVEAGRVALINTQDPIYNIAINSGYSNADQFAQHFRKAFGMTPSAYRMSKRSAAS